MSKKLFGGAAPLKRVSEKESMKKAINKIIAIRKGEIKPLTTAWPKFNDALLNGLEWRTITVIGARPGVGKTAFMEQLTSDILQLNTDKDFRILKFQLEMVDETDGARKLSAKSGLDYDTLMSKKEPISKDKVKQLIDIYESIEGKGKANVLYDPCTINEMCASIHDEFEDFKRIEIVDGVEEVVYPNMLVCIDHSALFKLDTGQKDKFEMLGALGEAMTYMKKRYPLSFLVLSQLNRNIESVDRSKPGTYGNYILDSDIYGSDSLLQHADVVIGINRPFDKRLSTYGPDKLLIHDEDTLVFHFLKVRNGLTRTLFFKFNRENVRFEEIETPPRAESIN